MVDVTTLDPGQGVHRRLNPLSGKHVLVSPHRSKRPWNGQIEDAILDVLPTHDPKCYLCPGNTRMGGEKNPNYPGVFTFENDYPALVPSTNVAPTEEGAVFGKCSVMCFHPRHDLTLARMKPSEISLIIDGWTQVYKRESESQQGYVQIFENRGAMMGCSAPHPHGQVWAMSFIPDEPATELVHFSQYLSTHREHMLLAYAQAELQKQERVVAMDESGWVTVVPFWATWPFEVMILPSKRHIPSLLQLTTDERDGLARIFKETLVRYDNLFSCPFPYSMGIHQSPIAPNEPEKSSAQIHFHFYPPLLRSATIRKFMVGFELMGEAQRDITAEQAAKQLREVSNVHYTDK